MKTCKPKINMRLIANNLGISPMTVSRALNGSPLTTESTRSRIVSYVQELGYDSGNRLKTLNLERMKNIAVHCGEETRLGTGAFDFYMQLHYFCVKQVKQRGLTSHTVDLNSEDMENFSSLSQCGGMILLSSIKPQMLKKTRLAYPDLKIINMFGEVDMIPTVNSDDTAGGEIVGRYIAEKGHRHVAVFLTLANRSFRLRYAGLMAAAQNIDPEIRIDLVNYSNPPDKDEADRIREDVLDNYFSKNKRALPTVFFVPNCYAAVYLYNYLKRHELKVPEDIGIFGYDNVDYYLLIEREITRVYFDIKELAEQAVNTVCSLLENPEVSVFNINLPVKFIDGGSVLPVSEMRRK